MKGLAHYLPVLLSLLVVACGGSDQEGLEGKKAQLKEYRNEAKDLQSKITALEEEIATQDPDFAGGNKNATLVTTIPLKKTTFEHFIQVRGNVSSDRNVTISSQSSTKVVQVKVDKGDKVKKGQLLITQDGETIRRNIAELQTSLELAQTRYERQANLWKQKIGTEIQYLETKNNKESIERRLASARSQLDNYLVRAPFSGNIDEVFVKEGETAMPGTPMLRLVSLEDMYIIADISEAYLGEFERGDSVSVRFPSLNKTIKSTISSVGQVIDVNNRTFEVQIKLPKDASLLRPNLLAVLEINDFRQPDAVAVPTNLIQNDNRGDYVFVAAKSDQGLVAQKKRVERGMTYNNKTMIKSGLEAGDAVIDEGSREVGEGVQVKIAEQNKADVAVSAR